MFFLGRVGHVREPAAVRGCATPGVQEDPADRGGGVVPGGGLVAVAGAAKGPGGRQGGDGRGDGEPVRRGGRPDGG